MSKSNFQKLLSDTISLANYISDRYADAVFIFPKANDPRFTAVITDTVMLYLSSAMQGGWQGKKSVYRLGKEYYPMDEERYTRKFYRHENKLREYADRKEPNVKRSYDAADYISIQNRTEKADLLTEYVGRRNIHISNSVSNPQLANAFRQYDEEYRDAAAGLNDEDYIAYSIYFYRKEHAMAFSLIAHIADYMNVHRIKFREFNFKNGSLFWTSSLVRNVEFDHEVKTFEASPNVLLYYESIPFGFKHIPEKMVYTEQAARQLKQNVFERLPSVQRYGEFEVAEVADFIRVCYPIIERHMPVSFYLDEECKKVDGPKVKLVRKIMKEFYTFGKE